MRMRWAGYLERMGEMRNAYKILVGQPVWKGLFWSPRHTWEDNIRMDIREIWCEGEDWIHLAQDRGQWLGLVNRVMKLRVPYNSGKFLTSWVTISFSERPLLHALRWLLIRGTPKTRIFFKISIFTRVFNCECDTFSTIWTSMRKQKLIKHCVIRLNISYQPRSIASTFYLAANDPRVLLCSPLTQHGGEKTRQVVQSASK